jgi:rRNA-processing protein FCF1
MPTLATISVTEEQADDLFGKLGTHSKCAGATFWLRDQFFSDKLGRKITISSDDRRLAAAAIRTLLFQLSVTTTTPTTPFSLSSSSWYYIDTHGKKQGPHTFKRMTAWSKKGAFGHASDSLLIQHSSLLCWLPLWFLVISETYDSAVHNGDDLNEEIMVDWEDVVDEINALRAGKNNTASGGSDNIVGAPTNLLGSSSSSRDMLQDFPELMKTSKMGGHGSVEPMDYEGSTSAISRGVVADGAHVVLVLDTNVLLSHLATTMRICEDLGARHDSESDVELLVIVPWIVLNELDRFKDIHDRQGGGGGGGGEDGRSGAARRALKQIRLRTSSRDNWLKIQTADEYEKMCAEVALPNGPRELHNDDRILQTCLGASKGIVDALRSAGHRAAVFLLTNDKGLSLRAQVVGIKCFTPSDLPRTGKDMVAHVPAAVGAPMDERDGDGTSITTSVAPEYTPSPSPSPSPSPRDSAPKAAAAASNDDAIESQPVSYNKAPTIATATATATSPPTAPSLPKITTTTDSSRAAARKTEATAAAVWTASTSQNVLTLISALGLDPRQVLAALDHIQKGGQPTPQIAQLLGVLKDNPQVLGLLLQQPPAAGTVQQQQQQQQQHSNNNNNISISISMLCQQLIIPHNNNTILPMAITPMNLRIQVTKNNINNINNMSVHGKTYLLV